MERRLARLEVTWRRTGALASPREMALAGTLAEAIRYPERCAPPTATEQRTFLDRTIALARLPPGAVERALIAALIASGMPDGETVRVVREAGVDGMLAALSPALTEIASLQLAAEVR